MAEVLSDETKKQRLEQLAKWGYEFKKENNRLTDFLILHWEDTQILAESVGERVQGLFQCIMPTIGKYITEKNWKIVIKNIIELSAATDANQWFGIKFMQLRVIIDERTLPYVLELAKIPRFCAYVENIRNLSEGNITDIKNCLGPELVSILKSAQYVPDAIMLIPFMKNLVQVFLQNNIEVVYAIDKSGRILGYLFFCVITNLGLSKKAKFYFMNVKTIDPKSLMPEKVGVLYSEKQKKELIGKNVLLIDECIIYGETMTAAYELLSSFVGRNGKVIPVAFSAAQNKKSKYHAVTPAIPSWYYQSGISGVKETEQGTVEVDEGSREMATAVRKAFSKYGKLIAEYLKENMGI